jgi:hypothetical protein
MDTITTLTQVPAYLALPRPRCSTWDAPIQGSGMSAVATGANRKATGGLAFEDPD